MPEKVEKPQRAKSGSRELLEWVITLAVAVGLALAVHKWVGQLVTVSGPSMQPTLWDEEKVLLGKVEYYFAKPKRGDIVVLKYQAENENLIKRVIATGGETIKVSGGSVYIDGRKLQEPYLPETIEYEFLQTTVPEGRLFVMGDNRNDSMDSHFEQVGFIDIRDIEGRAYALVWPLNKFAVLTQYTGVLK